MRTLICLPACAVLGALALAPVALPRAASAADRADFAAKTVGELADLCAATPNNPRDTAARNFCEGYAQGVVALALERVPAGQPKPLCFPSPAPTRDQTLREFVGWARAEPARLRMRAADGLLRFLGERFPCK
jgi:hypothetical protein